MSLDLISCMKSFVTVIECGSFSKAAQKLYMSNSVLTKQIKYLENNVNTSLISRTTRSLSLTNSGRLYLEKVKTILADIEDANLSLHNLDKSPHGSINLSMPGPFQSGKFIKIIAKFLEKYPKITINTTNHTSPIQLLDKSMDIVISECNMLDKQFTKKYLVSYTRGLFASPNYIKKHGTPKHIKDLQQHNCIVYKPSSPTDQWTFASNKRIKVQGNYNVISGVSTTSAAIEGIGLMWLPHSMLSDEVESGKLVEIQLATGPLEIATYIYYLPTTYNGIVKLLIDFILKSTK